MSKLNTIHLQDKLEEIFSIRLLEDPTPHEGGYLCNNYVLKTDAGTLFLKEYRRLTSSWVHEIKFAEEFFFKSGIPAIMPMKDKFGRSAFWMDEKWYSLFPFVTGRVPKYGELSETTVESLGAFLGKLHLIGSTQKQRPFQPLAMWDRDRFYLESIEILEALKDREGDPDPFFQEVKETVGLKKRLVDQYRDVPPLIALPRDHLLHGDVIYQNVFIGADDKVTHIYDFERARVGPRAFELARSLFINCFDDGWEKRNVEMARLYLSAYFKEYPMSFEEFRAGVELYYLDVIHSMSMEAKFLLFDSKKHMKLYASYSKRIRTLHEMDLNQFCRDLYLCALSE